MDAITPNIFVHNLSDTIAYYEKLGFTVDMTVPGEDGPVWAKVTCDAVSFMFQTFVSLGDELPEVSRQDGGSLIFYIIVKDVTAFYEQVKGKTEVIKGLEKTFYGATEFTVRDINNYLLTFATMDA